MPRADDSPVTWGDLKKVYKTLNDRISDAFEAISTGDNTQSEFWNEHEDKINRHQRAIKRAERRLDELEGNDDD